MARRHSAPPACQRRMTVLLDEKDAALVDMASDALDITPEEVLKRGLYLFGLAGELVLGAGRATVRGQANNQRV